MADHASSRGHNGDEGQGSGSRPSTSKGAASSSKSSRPGSSTGTKSKSDKPSVKIGQYTLQQTLGTGSFGKVKRECCDERAVVVVRRDRGRVVLINASAVSVSC